MLGLDIQCLPGDCVATTLLQCLKGSIKVDSVLDASRIAWYLQHIKKEDYDTEQANYEAQDPQAKYRAWEVFVRNAILIQILETKPQNRRVEFYNKGVLRAFGTRRVSGLKKKQKNHEIHEARHELARRADDEYRRYCQRHSHRSGRNGRRGLQLDPVFEDENENPPAKPYREFFIRIDPSFYAIKRCAESVKDRENGQKYTREPVYEAVPSPPPAPFYNGPGALPPEPVHYVTAPPTAPFQGDRGQPPSDYDAASSAHGGRGSFHASRHSATILGHGGGRAPSQGLDRGAANFLDLPHRQPTRPSEIPSHRPTASPTLSHREPSRASSRASSDRHSTSSKASSRASSRAPSHALSNTRRASSASFSLEDTRATSNAAFDEPVSVSGPSVRRLKRAPSHAFVHTASMGPSGPRSPQTIRTPANEPTSGTGQTPEPSLRRASGHNFPSPAATAGEAALMRAAIAESSRASNERSRRPPLPSPDSESNSAGESFAMTNKSLPEDNQPRLPSVSGSRRASSNYSSSTSTLKTLNKETPVGSGSRRASRSDSSNTVVPKGSNHKEPASGSRRASSRGSNSTTTRVSKGKEPASRSKAKPATVSSVSSSDESDIESISSWHSDGGRGPPKWGNRECLAWESVSGEPK